MKKTIVTTSWDDGHVLDLKLALLLRKYGMAGTFYISPENREIIPSKRLSKEQILELSKDFEIGAHTMTHPQLSLIDSKTARREIVSSKQILESWIGREVKSFCYPRGEYLSEHKQMVRDAGFSLARTVKYFSVDIGDNPFEIPTTVHVYRHWSYAVEILKEVGIYNFIGCYLNWDRLAMFLFEKTLARGGVFHLWGHSWEIEKNNDWERLERVLKYISSRPNVEYVNNKQLV